MKRFFSLALCLTMLTFAGSALAASTGGSADRGSNSDQIHIATWDEGAQVSTTSSKNVRFKQAAGPDTFAIYGGYGDPNNPEGKFQDVNGVIPDAQGWTGVDETDAPVYWQISTVNAANLGSGSPNHAAWSGRTAAQAPGFVSGQGYGNSWSDILLYTATVTNPGVGQTVNLDFNYNYESEAGYDFFLVQYDSAGSWKICVLKSGRNEDTNGNLVTQTFATTKTHDIVYDANGYGGVGGDEIRIRLRGYSDSGWSDQDGLNPTAAGLAQVDEINISHNDGSNFEDFETATDLASTVWKPDKALFAGDFSHVIPTFTSFDPCRQNPTPQFGFMDEGQVVNNSASAADIPGYPTSTGGETSDNWSYGVSGGWVLNYNGGLSAGAAPLFDEIWSPEIAWDVASTTTDDTPDFAGAFVRWTSWMHLPQDNGILFRWAVRSQVSGSWGGWQDSYYHYYGSTTGAWSNIGYTVQDKLNPNRDHVQFKFAAKDMAAAFGSPGTDATPAPTFDNFSFVKYRISGPSIVVNPIELSNDGFPASGDYADSNLATHDALDVAFDMAQDIRPRLVTSTYVGGDSVTCQVKATLPGTTITDIRMFWILDRNPHFDDVRTFPARAKDVNPVVTATQWSGEVLADTCRGSSGAIITDKFFADLPDVDFLYPGDTLRWYWQATDSGTNVTTLPANVTGFATGTNYSRSFTVNGLPSMTASGQPTKLMVNDAGHGLDNEILSSMDQLGYTEGVDYDLYIVNGPSSGVSNSIGAAGNHGANADQLAGYDTILYFGGGNFGSALSDGSQAGNGADKADDVGVLTAWHGKGGDRNIAYFGDYIVSSLTAAAQTSFGNNVMGVTLFDVDVRDEIDNQTAPVVRPVDVNFSTEYVAYGGCLGINAFDSLRVVTGSHVGHGFVDLTNNVYPDIGASIIYDRTPVADRLVDVTFPYSAAFIYNKTGKTQGATSARTELFRELFAFFGVTGTPGSGVASPAVKPISMNARPNPFNPQTTIKFANLPQKAVGSVKVYNLRGELVATLHTGEFTKDAFVWNGTDDNGASVASGVYMVEGQANDFRQVVKVALVK